MGGGFDAIAPALLWLIGFVGAVGCPFYTVGTYVTIVGILAHSGIPPFSRPGVVSAGTGFYIVTALCRRNH